MKTGKRGDRQKWPQGRVTRVGAIWWTRVPTIRTLPTSSKVPASHGHDPLVTKKTADSSPSQAPGSRLSQGWQWHETPDLAGVREPLQVIHDPESDDRIVKASFGKRGD